MSLTVRFFASLAERLGRREVVIDAAGIATALDAWRAVVPDQDPPPNTLVAVNMEYVPASRPVRDGDQVAFMPPVTGG